jgi:hypothetical protein
MTDKNPEYYKVQDDQLVLDTVLKSAYDLRQDKIAQKQAKLQTALDWLKNVDCDNLTDAQTIRLYKHIIRCLGIMNTLDNN